MAKRRRQTAGDFLAELEADPVWMSRKKARDESFLKTAEELSRFEAPLVEELRASGTQVDSVWDLVNSSEPYPSAVIPILLKHVTKPYPDRVREGIARALATPQARQGWHIVRELFLTSDDQTAIGVKWALGCALAGMINDEVMDDLVSIVSDERHGANRLALVLGLLNSDHPKASAVLRTLGDDPQLGGEVRRLMRVKRMSGRKLS